MHGPPYFSKAATAFTMRSAPTSPGLSYSTGMPVFTPGSMKSGLLLKYRSQTSRSVESSGGTTEEMTMQDRKSTRLNSSHGYISYAVFCLKKKKNDLHHGTA